MNRRFVLRALQKYGVGNIRVQVRHGLILLVSRMDEWEQQRDGLVSAMITVGAHYNKVTAYTDASFFAGQVRCRFCLPEMVTY